jgi:hypothetical protein
LKLPKGTPIFEIGDEETRDAPETPADQRKVLPISPPQVQPAPAQL